MTEPSTKVAVMPLSKERADDLLKEVVKFGRWSFPGHDDLAPGWKWLVTNRQVERCLADGYILDDKIGVDEHGNWKFNIGRVCAGVNVILTVALERGPPLPHLYVIGIDGNVIVL